MSFLTVKEVADWLNCHNSTIYRMLKKKKIPAMRIGSDWRFNVEDLRKWVADISTTSL